MTFFNKQKIFDTIGAKMIFLTLFFLSLLCLIEACAVLLNLKNYKSFVYQEYDLIITAFSERLNNDISSFSDNVNNVALIGELYYKTRNKEGLNIKNAPIPRIALVDTFETYTKSIGGGVWFLPYKVNPDKKYNCLYSFRNNDGKVVIDDSYDSEAYDYPNQSWYKEIVPKLVEDRYIYWSSPYYEKEGSNSLMTTAGTGMFDDNGNLIGIATVDWKISDVIANLSKIKPTKNSFAVFVDSKGSYIIGTTEKYSSIPYGTSLKTIPWYSDKLKSGDIIKISGIKHIASIKTLSNGMLLIVCVPEKELYGPIVNYLILLFVTFILVSFLIAFCLYLLLKKNVNEPIQKLTDAAIKIGNNNLDIKIDIDKPKEFAELAKTFNSMASDIKTYISNLRQVTNEKEVMESELSIAGQIQNSALPSTFFPHIKEFDIYAHMDTAKQIGGDFYDCFFINPKTFMFLVADVSGKGIPAALFMMKTKTIIESVAGETSNPKEMVFKINNALCQNNAKNIFVTMFACILNIETGEISCINCGHNPPLIKKSFRNFEYLKTDPNLVLGAVENTEYQVLSSRIKPNDIIFLYTDGVTEALNDKNEMYGEERLLASINDLQTNDCTHLINGIKKNIISFENGTEQFDDITMLAFRFNGNSKKEYVDDAKVENFPKFLSWIDALLDENKIPSIYKQRIELISEEIYVNIANYAYKNTTGKIKVLYEHNYGEIVLKFIDEGVKYNPLEKEDPDITLSAEERKIGGLGIHMVKNTADDVSYEYSSNCNILTVKLFVNTFNIN